MNNQPPSAAPNSSPTEPAATPKPVPQLPKPEAPVSNPYPSVVTPAAIAQPPPISGGPRKKPILLALAVIIVVAAIGGLVFQIQSDRAYQSKIKPLYDKQFAEMTLVYKSFSRPVFASNDSTPAGDAQDLQYINSVIKTADSETSNLSAKNKLTIIPGTQLLGPVSKTDKEHKAISKYLSDSKSFLANYQALSTYTGKLDGLTDQFTQFINALGNMANDTSISQLSTDALSASTTVNSINTSLKNANPPSDLQQLNADIISALGEITTDLDGITTGVNTRNSDQITNSASNLGHDVSGLVDAMSTDISTPLQNSSAIHKQILNLESEKNLAG